MNSIQALAPFAFVYSTTMYVLLSIMTIRLAKYEGSYASTVIIGSLVANVTSILSVVSLIISIVNLAAG